MQDGKTKRFHDVAGEILWGTKFAGIMVGKGILLTLMGAGLVVCAIPAGTALATYGMIDRFKKKASADPGHV